MWSWIPWMPGQTGELRLELRTSVSSSLPDDRKGYTVNQEVEERLSVQRKPRFV